jgi:hypothetical protein
MCAQVIIQVPIEDAIRSKDLNYKLSPSSITLGIKVGCFPVLLSSPISSSVHVCKHVRCANVSCMSCCMGRENMLIVQLHPHVSQGKEPVLDGVFWGGNRVQVDECNYEIEIVPSLGRCVVITLTYVLRWPLAIYSST